MFVYGFSMLKPMIGIFKNLISGIKYKIDPIILMMDISGKIDLLVNSE